VRPRVLPPFPLPRQFARSMLGPVRRAPHPTCAPRPLCPFRASSFRQGPRPIESLPPARDLHSAERMRIGTSTTLAALLALPWLGGCVSTLPAPPAPPQALPDVAGASSVVTTGETRVIIATDVPARVEQAGGRTLCPRTPCAVSLPEGDYELRFRGIHDEGRASVSAVGVRGRALAVNHTLGQDRSSAGQIAGPVLMTVGGVLLVLASFVVVSAVADSDRQIPQSETRKKGDTAEAMALLGLGSLVGGGIFWGATPEVRQPGSTTTWAPALPTARGAAAGVKF
jgi:hypothetical protein